MARRAHERTRAELINCAPANQKAAAPSWLEWAVLSRLDIIMFNTCTAECRYLNQHVLNHAPSLLALAWGWSTLLSGGHDVFCPIATDAALGLLC